MTIVTIKRRVAWLSLAAAAFLAAGCSNMLSTAKDAKEVDTVTSGLEIGLGTSSGSLGSVTGDITLPKIAEGAEGATITWTSSNEGVISSTGKVIRPAYEQPDETVTLTATITKGSITQTKTYTIKVKAHTATLRAFSFGKPAATGVIAETGIALSVPYATDASNLVANFEIEGEGKLQVGGVDQKSGETANDFTKPVTYALVEADGSSQEYKATVTASASDEKKITAFSFAALGASGMIDETAHAIAVTLPYGTNVKTLVASFSISGQNVAVAGVAQASGTTANDFTDPITYTVAAANGSTQDYTVTVTIKPLLFTYSITDGTCTITGLSADWTALADTDSDKYTIAIPSNIDGNAVVSIGELAFSEKQAIKNVTIPDGVTSLGASAFKSCENLTSVVLPSSVTEIKNNAFSGCTSLASVSFPSNLVYIRHHAFYGCTGLTGITLPASLWCIDSYAFSNCTQLQSADLSSTRITTQLGEGAFESCRSLENVSLPSTLTTIGWSCFYGCTALENMDIPDNVAFIGFYAFEECTALKSIDLPSKLTIIKKETFKGCSSLESIVIPSAVTTIQDDAFYNCTSLVRVEFPSNLGSIGYRSFALCTGLKVVVVSAKTPPSIKESTFYSCSAIEAIYVPADSLSAYKTATYWKNYSSKMQAIQ
jgi:hypothetical protein